MKPIAQPKMDLLRAESHKLNQSDMRFTFHTMKPQLVNQAKARFDMVSQGAFSHSNMRMSRVGNRTTFNLNQVQDRSRNTGYQKAPSLMLNNVNLPILTHRCSSQKVVRPLWRHQEILKKSSSLNVKNASTGSRL